MNRWIKTVISFFIFLFSWGCMLEESPPENQRLISSLFSYEGENRTGIGLLTVLKQQTLLQENTLELLGRQEELLYDYTELRSGPIYRTYYLIPIRDKTTNRINKAFVYKIMEEETEQTNAFRPVISEIIVLDAQELNRIPAHQRFLYSSPFKKWEEKGLNVSSDLTDFAKKLDGKWHRLEPHEFPVSVTRISIGSFVTMTYELHLNNGEDEDGIIVYGIPSYVADSIFLSNQHVLESCLGEQISFYFDYRSFTIRLEDGDLTTNPNLDIAIGNFMAANDLSFQHKFSFYHAITWEITATSADPPSGGDNTGGNSSGGSTGGGSSPNIDICPNCMQSMNECKCPQQVEASPQAINNMITTTGMWNQLKTLNLATIFLDKYRNDSVEYAITLENIDGKYLLTTPYTDFVYNRIKIKYNKTTEAAVHNHPKGFPPSILDVFTLAKINEYNKKFIYSFIVPKQEEISGEELTYVLYIENPQKAQNFHEIYNSQQAEISNEMGAMLTWLISNAGEYQEKKLYGYALAGILKEKDSGIVLLQSKGNEESFKQLDATVEINADGTIHHIEYTICK